jgi:citronellol/citronellal dehydrogenase
VSGLVNNAGGQFPAPLLAISKKGFDAVVANNLTGGFLMMRELFNQCMQAHGGSIVNMTADFRNGMPGMGHSGAARAGMANLTATAAFDGAPAGVRVNAVAPSLAMHPFLSKVTPPGLLEELTAREAFGRAAEPWEVANVMVFLASDYASYLTGEVVSVSSQHA